MCAKGLNRTQIKTVAIAAMAIDHTALFLLGPSKHPELLPLYMLMRTIGRLTGPAMFFFLAEGFSHTSSREKYALRLLVFGLISQLPYALVHAQCPALADYNVILTLFLSCLMLTAAERIENRWLNAAAVFTLILLSFPFDWGMLGPLMTWFFWRNRENRRLQRRFYALLCMIQVLSCCLYLLQAGQPWYGEIWQIGMFLFLPFLSLYNGEPGRKGFFGKWAFYLFYPAHLFVFWLILRTG